MVHLKIFTIITAVFMATVGYGQIPGKEETVLGADNISSVVKSSLNAIPNLRVGSVTGNFVYKAIFLFRKDENTCAYNYAAFGKLSIDDVTITMSDGEMVTFKQEGSVLKTYHKLFVQSGYSGYELSIPVSIDGTSSVDGKNSSFTNQSLPTSTMRDETDKNISTGNFEHSLGGKYININCTGLTQKTITNIKSYIEQVRKRYDLLKKSQQDRQNYQNSGNNSSSSSSLTLASEGNSSSSGSSNSTSNQGFQSSNEQNNSTNNNTQTPNQFNNTPAPVYDSKEWEKFNQMQQNVNQWNQDWYKRIEQNEQIRLQKQALYEQAGEQIGTIIGNYLNELEQRKQREEIAKKQKAINSAVSNAFSSVKKEASYWSSFLKDLLNVANKYSKNLDKTAYDEIESSLNAIKRTLDEIGKEHNSLQEKLRKDWDYADNDPRRFRVSYWEDYSFRKEAYIDFYQTFTVGSRISDKTIRCNFVNDLLPLINKHAERRQSTYHITSIEQAYIASGCKNYNYENLLKSAKAIEAYEKMRNEKTKQIQALKKKVEEELVEIKVLESTGVKVENISNQYQIEGVDLSDLKNEYNLLKGNSGAFENELKKLNPDNLIKAYGGANTGSLVFKPSGIYVAPGTFEVTLSREFSSPQEHKVTLNAQKGQKTLTINPMDYDSVFEFDARFKPYKVVLAKYQKKNSFGKMYWLVPEFKFYTSGIIEFNLTPLGFIKSYNPKGFYRGRPVFIHKINFLGLSVSKINLINGFVTSDSSSRYKLHSDFTSFGIDIMRYEAGFTQPLFNGRSELRLFAGATSPIRFFSVNQKEEFSVPTSPFDFEEGSYNRWFGGITIYPRIEFVSHIGKTMIEFGYAYNFILFFDDLETYTESEKLKSQIGQDELYQKYLPLNNFKNLLTHEFSVRFIF